MLIHSLLVFALFYALLFAALGVEVPFFPQILASTGLTTTQVGVLLAAGTLAQIFVGPILGRLADRHGTRIALTVASALAAADLFLFSETRSSVWMAQVAFVLFAIATAPLNPLADAMAVPACAAAGVPYGFVRGIGSAGFLAGIMLGSALTTHFGTASVLSASATLLGLLTLTTAALPARQSVDRPEETSESVWALLRIRAFQKVLLIAILVIGSHAMSDAFAVINWTQTGLPPETIGYLLSAAVASEFVVFVALGPVLLRACSPELCLAIGAFAGGVRWATLAKYQTAWPLLASQLLHGLTFSLVHLASMQLLNRAVPKHFFATAQSLYNICCNAIASAVITSVSGVLFQHFHASAFWLASVLCLAALPLCVRTSVAD